MGGSPSTLLDQPKKTLLDQSWKRIDWNDQERFLTEVKKYKPSGPKHLRVLLYGPVGAGKSSFINSVGTLILGRDYCLAGVETSASKAESCTRQYKTHKIGQHKMVFSDVMGLEPGCNVGVRPDDIILAMKGHVKDKYNFDPAKPLSPENKEFYNPEPSIDDKVHVLVCMLDANAPQIHPGTLQKMKEIREAARDLDIPQIAVATHVDLICGEIEKDIKNVYRSIYLKEQMDKFSSTVGIHVNNIFPVWNNYKGGDKNVDTVILDAVKHIMDYGDDFLNELN